MRLLGGEGTRERGQRSRAYEILPQTRPWKGGSEE